METEMVNRFEEAMARMSDAEFLTMWEEVKREGGEGPTAAEFIANFAYQPAISFKGIESSEFTFAGDYNFAMAA